MYARVLRKWSPYYNNNNTNLMSLMWLVVLTMLLLIACAPTTTSSTAITAAATSRAATAISSSTNTKVVAASTTLKPMFAGSSYTRRRSSWQPAATVAVDTVTAAAVDRRADTNVGDAAEESSYYIPVNVGGGADNKDSGNSNALLLHVADRIKNRASAISNKNFSNSRLHSNNIQQQQQQLPVVQQQHQQQQEQQPSDDSLAYAFYYKARAQPAPTVFANNSPQHQQHVAAHSSGSSSDYNEYDESDDELLDTAMADDISADENADDDDDEDDLDDADDEDLEETEEHVAAATYNTLYNYNKQVPNVPNSQITNLYNKFTKSQQQLLSLQQQEQQQSQQQQQQVATANVHSTKARRHIQTPYYMQQQQQHHGQQQQQQHVAALPPQTFHSPVRETVTMNTAVASKSNSSSNTTVVAAAAATVATASSLPPYRYIIESFEIPITLPNAEYMSSERRLLLLQQQQQRMLLQKQVARNRRNSRAFGVNLTAGSNYRQEQHFYNSQQQQQQQQLQPYQRLQPQLQQHHNANNNHNNNNHKHHKHQHNREQQQQHQNHHHQQQHRQQHKRRRYCSARDPAQLAFEAPTVFEGKIISMTPDRRANFSATVEVKEVFKQQIGFRLQKYLRLQFAYRHSGGECDIYREQLRPRGLVRGDELEQGRIYLLFVQQIDLGNFTILGQPIRKTRHVVEAVKNAVSENYAQLASIRSITASNRTVENGKELRIVCKVQGRPPPKVTWFKDHKSINRNRKLYQIVPYKKRSELIIRSFNSSDAGRYECRAKNKVNHNLERRAIVIKAFPVPRYEPPLTGGTTGHVCPPDAAEFCFNGGTCKLFVEIGSYSCICPEGFIGERCDRKEINNMPPSTYSNEQECGEKKYLGSYYC